MYTVPVYTPQEWRGLLRGSGHGQASPFTRRPRLCRKAGWATFDPMFDRHARRLRRRALLDMKLGDSFLRGELAKPLLAFALSVLAARSLGADALAILLLPALPCVAWAAFIVRHWWTVPRRFSDRYHHLFTKKGLSREYRAQASPYKRRRQCRALSAMLHVALDSGFCFVREGANQVGDRGALMAPSRYSR